MRATGLAGSAARPLGRALAAAGRTDDAIDALEAAIAADRARGGVPFAARAQRDLAEVLLARGAPGRRRASAGAARQAAAAADRLGLAEPARRARALLASRYGRASSTRLNGVSAARRIERKPLCSSTARSVASPACAPSAGVLPARVGDRVRDADQRRAGVEEPADRVEVVLGAVARLRLDEHQRPVGRERLADVARRGGRIAEVVEGVEETDEVVPLARERVGSRHLEPHPLRDAGFRGRLARPLDPARMRVEARETTRMGRPRP